MKKILISICILLTVIQLQAQFKSASLTASGLTCAMCTKAINNSLEQLPFIKSVKPDIKNSAFAISFNEDVSVDFDQLKKAVEDAGFSVAVLKATAQFNNTAVKHDTHIKIDGRHYHFVNISEQTLNGEKTLTLIDKDFLPAKQFKKFASATKLQCIETGKSAACCPVEHSGRTTRIFHVTI